MGLGFLVWGVSIFGFKVLESKKTLALRRDLSMSEDMGDPMQANVGIAAISNWLKGHSPKSLTIHDSQIFTHQKCGLS